jgi:hypothetical protein
MVVSKATNLKRGIYGYRSQTYHRNGTYRPVNDEGLQIYLVVTEFVDNETHKT